MKMDTHARGEAVLPGGRRGRRRSIVAVLAGCLFVLVGWQSAIASAASITVSPASVPQGGKVKVSGSGFVPSESVTLRLDGVKLTSKTAAADGTVTKSVVVPLATSVGSHTVSATGSKGSSASAGLTVTPGYRATVMADSPSVYYRLDDGAATTMADASGNGHNASYSTSGNVTVGVAGALKSEPDTAVTSSGGPNAIGTLASAAFLPIGTSPRTIEAWYRSTDTQRHGVVGYGNSGQSNAFGMAVAANRLVIDVYQGTMEFTTGTKNLDDGKWHYLVITWTGTNSTAYADAKKLTVQSTNIVKPLHTTSPSTLFVGGWLDTVLNQKMIGSLDEVAVYATALTGTRVKAHYVAAGY
jgi:hypothetical protein